MAEKNDKTTMLLSKKTLERLAAHGGKKDTYDTILNDVLDFVEGKKRGWDAR